jgi:cell volume regulation protein A
MARGEHGSTRSLLWRFAPLLLVALSLGCTLDDTSRYLIMIAALFLLGAVGEVIFARTQVPDVVWLILAGVVLHATGAVDPAILDPILPLFSALTLIIVLFDGGRQIVINDLVTAAPRASALAVLGFVVSMFGVAVVVQLAALTGLLPESWTFTHSLMVGAILGGSSSLIIMPSMLLAKVEPKVSNLVGLESALTDALCVVVAVVLMNVIHSGEASSGRAVLEFGENFGLALLIGMIAGWVWMPVLRTLSGNLYAYPVTLAALLCLYVIVDNIGGNPAMAVLTFSVVVGNAAALMNKIGFSLGDRPLALDDTVVTVHTQATFFIKSFFFTYIGLRLSPPWSLIIVGVLVGVVLYLTRIPVTMIIAGKSGGFDDDQQKMITISLPRGMAAGVLATLPSSEKYAISGTEELPAMVFAAVVTSIAIFAFGFRQVRKRAHATKIVVPVIAEAMPDGSLPVQEVELVSAVAPVAALRPSEPEPEPPLVVAGDLMPNGMPAAHDNLANQPPKST